MSKLLLWRRASCEARSRGSGCAVATFTYKAVMQSALPQLRLEKIATSSCKSSTGRGFPQLKSRQLSTKVAREEHSAAPAAQSQRLRTKLVRKARSRSSGSKFATSYGWKVALFKYKSSTRGGLWSSKVVHELRSRSSRSKFATSRRKSTSASTQLRLRAQVVSTKVVREEHSRAPAAKSPLLSTQVVQEAHFRSPSSKLESRNFSAQK